MNFSSHCFVYKLTNINGFNWWSLLECWIYEYKSSSKGMHSSARIRVFVLLQLRTLPLTPYALKLTPSVYANKHANENKLLIHLIERNFHTALGADKGWCYDTWSWFSEVCHSHRFTWPIRRGLSTGRVAVLSVSHERSRSVHQRTQGLVRKVNAELNLMVRWTFQDR